MRRSFRGASSTRALLCATLVAVSCGRSLDAGPAGKAKDAFDLAHPTVSIEILGIGLDSHIAASGPVVLRYRIANHGPETSVSLSFEETDTGAQPPFQGFMERNSIVPRTLGLFNGDEREGRWILQGFAKHWGAKTRVWLLARDATGRLLGATLVPDPIATSPVAIIAPDAAAAVEVQQRLDWSSSGRTSLYMPRPEWAAVVGRPPTLWYEYLPALFVVLATPLGSLSGDAQAALRRWTALGGDLVILADLCPDWQAGPWAGLSTSSSTPAKLGAGRVHLAPVASGQSGLSGWLLEQGLLSWSTPLPGTDRVNSAFMKRSWIMPDTWVLVGAVLVIILVVGPLIHLGLARLRRREWAWVMVPAASVVLSIGMYALATGVKGVGSGLEVHHVVFGTGGSPESLVSTTVRLMSPERRSFALRVRATQPMLAPSYGLAASGFSGAPPPATVIRPDGLEVRGIAMQRYSLDDHGTSSLAPAVPLSVEWLEDGTGIVVANTAKTPITDVFVLAASGWIAAGAGIDPGESIRVGGIDAGVAIGELEAPFISPADLEWTRRVLQSLPYLYQGEQGAGDLTIVAGCAAPGMPRVTVTPEPDSTLVRTTCVWRIAGDAPAGQGAVP